MGPFPTARRLIANTLPAVVQTCHLMQCPCLIVRVGPPASKQYVRACLDVLQNVLDFRVTEAACRLEEVGVAKHSSWRFVALHGSLGNLSIPPMPSSGKLFVRDVQPVEKNMPLAFVVGWGLHPSPFGSDHRCQGPCQSAHWHSCLASCA